MRVVRAQPVRERERTMIFRCSKCGHLQESKRPKRYGEAFLFDHNGLRFACAYRINKHGIEFVRPPWGKLDSRVYLSNSNGEPEWWVDDDRVAETPRTRPVRELAPESAHLLGVYRGILKERARQRDLAFLARYEHDERLARASRMKARGANYTEIGRELGVHAMTAKTLCVRATRLACVRAALRP